MKYSFALLAAATAVYASPVALPQAVTSKIAPSAPAPSGCMPNYSGSFGVVVMNITASAGGAKSSAPVTQSSDGQPAASTGKASSAPVTQLTDGQPGASTGKATASAPVSQITDGQPQASTGPKTMMSMMPITQIGDGQIQATTAHQQMSMVAVSQISDGQIQATTKMTMVPVTSKSTAAPVSQISDGQIQATTKASSAAPVSQISDGQIQATTSAKASTAAPVSQISDGQPQATTKAATSTAAPVSQISDGQPQATTMKTSAVSQISDGQPQATKSGYAAAASSMVACSGPGVLNLTLSGGVLLDSQGRTGYIASNYQFQFDKPAQAGAIYTAGWSICGNGSLALGGSTTFYQCLSGNFYNLYDRNWAPQCNPVNIDILQLVNCS